MSGQEGIASVLREHGGIDEREGGYWCICGAELPLDGLRVPFSDHVAVAVVAWIEETLASEATWEALWMSIADVRDAAPRRVDDADTNDVVTAALDAVAAALRDQP